MARIRREAALGGEFAVGQRVMTIDQLPGRVQFAAASFSPGVTEYEVQLDGNLGHGTYVASQLRPLPADYRAGQAGSNLPAGVTAALEAEAAEVHTADMDYPEFGSVLSDRPDPGGLIRVIGLRKAAGATYGRPEDERDEDYNGGELQDTGMNWAEPGQQPWMHEHGLDQEGAPPPAFMPPMMARLAEIEETQRLIGMAHHATTINGQQVDHHGDAPEHGSVPRAQEPNSYDDRSTEGDGDPVFNSPMDPEKLRANNGAAIGSFPEGISAGGGPGMSIGYTATRIGSDTGPLSIRGLEDHLTGAHGYNHQDIGLATAGHTLHGWARNRDALHASHLNDHANEGFANWEEHPHEALTAGRRSDGGPLNPRPSNTETMMAESLRSRWEEDHPRGEDPLAPREDSVADGVATYHSHEGPIDPVFGSRHVPWTDKERNGLHQWDNGPAASWGDFVNRTHFTNKTPPEEATPGAEEEILAEAARRVAIDEDRDPHEGGRWEFDYNYDDTADAAQEPHQRDFEATDWTHVPGGRPEHARAPRGTEEFGEHDWATEADPNQHGNGERGRFDHTLSVREPDPERFVPYQAPPALSSGSPEHSDEPEELLPFGGGDFDTVADEWEHKEQPQGWVHHTLSSMRKAAADEDAFREHLLNDHGWNQGGIDRSIARGQRFSDMHSVLHQMGMSDHQHQEPAAAAREEHLDNMFGPDGMSNPGRYNPKNWNFHRPERGGQTHPDPMVGLIRSRPLPYQPEPDDLERAEPTRYRRMMSSRQASDGAKGELLKQLGDDYPPDALEWLHHATVSGPHHVPLTDIDWDDRHTWAAYKQPVKTSGFLDTMRKKTAAGKQLKPALIVATPGRKFIGDGHHRSVAQLLASAAGEGPPGVWAYTAQVGETDGPWDEMHGRQIHEKSKDDTGTEIGPDAPPEEVADFQDQVDSAVAATGAGHEHDADADSLGSPPQAWPMTRAPVTESGPAMTQGRHNGRTKRNMVPPGADTSNAGEGAVPKAGVPARPGQPKKAHLDAFVAAAGSPAFRFEFTASWHDVVAKARRIRKEGRVRITHVSAGLVIGAVSGDHDVYETGIQRPPHKPQTIQHWACGCPWASFNQDKSLGTRYAGRPCSHVMALQFEAQARTMFGREMQADSGVPNQELVVKSMPPWTPSGWSRTWLAPSASLARIALLAAGEDPAEVDALCALAGLSPSTRMLERHLETAHQGDHGAAYRMGISLPRYHDKLHEMRAAVTIPHVHQDNPEPQDGYPGLTTVSSVPHTADQANGPWGAQNVSTHPPGKPYGATQPPDKDMDPGSYGPLAGPDPENWGEIQDDSAYQMPLTNSASLLPPHLAYPDISDWQDENQDSFGYSDRANTAGPATAMNPADPQGLSVDAELKDEPEPALPSTTGDDLEATAAADGTIGGGDAGSGADTQDAADVAGLGSFGAVREFFRRGSPMGDQARAEFLQAQNPSPVGQEPGMGSGDEYLTPDDSSIQTLGNQQWSGGGADSDEVAVEPGDSSGSMDDIVASFQRSAAARQFGSGGGTPAADGDIAAAARQFLVKTADALPKAEADELINEGRGERARNLALLRLEGTHYADEDEDLARRGVSLDDYDDDVISV